MLQLNLGLGGRVEQRERREKVTLKDFWQCRMKECKHLRSPEDICYQSFNFPSVETNPRKEKPDACLANDAESLKTKVKRFYIRKQLEKTKFKNCECKQAS